MIKQFDEFVNEAMSQKQEQEAWRSMVLVTDNVQNIYGYVAKFAADLVSKGEKDNKKLHDKLLKDNYYKQELKHILDLMKDHNAEQHKKFNGGDSDEFLAMDEKDQLYMLAHRMCDEVEDYED